MSQHLTRLMCRLYEPDMLFELPADRFGLFEFYRAQEIVEAGAEAACRVLDRWEAGADARGDEDSVQRDEGVRL